MFCSKCSFIGQLEYIRSLVSEFCHTCEKDETFPKQNLHQYFKITICCFVPVHEMCFKECVIKKGECNFCKIGIQTKNETIWPTIIATSNYRRFREQEGPEGPGSLT